MHRPVEVLLTAPELAECEVVAERRAQLHEKAGRGNTNTLWRHLQGVVSEYALAKFFGPESQEYWRLHSAFKDENEFRTIREDVRRIVPGHRDGRFQVRSTTALRGNLLLLKKDDKSLPFVLVRMPHLGRGQADEGRCYLVGWAIAGDHMTDDNEATATKLRLDADYVVPADDLNPMETLP